MLGTMEQHRGVAIGVHHGNWLNFRKGAVMERLTNRNYGEISHTGRIIPYSKHCIGCITKDCDCGIVEDMVKKLADYEDLEEQGRLVKLPCKVGDIVYKPNSVTVKEIVEIKIESMFITESNFNISGRTTKMKYSFCCTPKGFGKTVFLTKSEAEAKLKELRGVE